MSSMRKLQCKLLSCGIFVILFFTLITKMKDGINISKLDGHEYTDHLEAVDNYYGVFQHLAQEGYLSPNSKSLCIQNTRDQEGNALKRVGISDVVAISGQDFHHFGNNTFDFVFFGQRTVKDLWSNQPLETVSEVCRTLRSGGYFVFHLKMSIVLTLLSIYSPVVDY